MAQSGVYKARKAAARCFHEILEHPFLTLSPSHIKVTGGVEELDIKQLRELLASSGGKYSVFCYDFQQDGIILVKVADGIDLYNVPFVYVAQRAEVVESLYIPVKMAVEISEEIASKFPQNLKLVHLYSVGRCGSTLLCKAMDATENCQSLSEPDVFTEVCFSTAAKTKSNTPAEHSAKMVSILRCAYVLLINFCLQNKPAKRTITIKYQSWCVVGAREIAEAFPGAKTIFLYREGHSYSQSIVRMMYNNSYWKYWVRSALRLDTFETDKGLDIFLKGLNNTNWNELNEAMDGVAKYPGHKGTIWLAFCIWMISMEAAAQLHAEDPENFFHLTMDFATLLRKKEESVKLLFEALGIAWKNGDEMTVAKTFEKDSQEGYVQGNSLGKASKSWFGEWERNALIDVMNHHLGLVKSFDYAF